MRRLPTRSRRVSESGRTCVDALRQGAAEEPGRLLYRFLDSQGERTATYADLDASARAVAAMLRAAGPRGARCLLIFPPGIDYIVGIFGCLYAGMIAVPAYPPDPRLLHHQLPRLESIVVDARAEVALTAAPWMQAVVTAQSELLRSLRWVATNAADPTDELFEAPADVDEIALIQYTSGTTREPRGVMVSHANLAHNSNHIVRAFGATRDSRAVLWLPPYHDMGLIGGILQGPTAGFETTLMSPLDFLGRPLSWLEAIGRYGATHSGAPNFGYEMCLRKTSARERRELDLSSWKVAFTGAEPIRASTLERFAEAFGPCGFRPEAFSPCYGLAEATLLVSGGSGNSAPSVRRLDPAALEEHRVVEVEQGGRPVVSCGRGLPDQEIAIVDPKTGVRKGESEIGEIWLSGPSVAKGYYGGGELSAEVFGARLSGDSRAFLRTGDYGFLCDGELFITGRLTDLIVIRGRNHHPQDIELTLDRCHPSLRPGCGAAFSSSVDGEERLTIVQEIDPRQEKLARDAIRAIRRAVAVEHGLDTHAVVLVKARTLPKTSSGKIRRRECRSRFLADRLEVVERTLRTPPVRRRTAHGEPDRGDILAAIIDLIAWWQESAPEEIDPDRPMSELGLDSVSAVGISATLKEWFGREFPPSTVYGDISVRDVAREISDLHTGHAGGEMAEQVAQLSEKQRRLLATRLATAGAHGHGQGGETIAIVGMACRFPGADTPDSFWQLLREGRDAVGEVPSSRWDVDAFYDSTPGTAGKMYTRWGGFLRDVESFDASFFGISPREAEAMDPQQRLLLEVTWEALENAGQVPASLIGSRTAVFVGFSNEEYSSLLPNDDPTCINVYSGTGIAMSVAAGRLSYALGLQGPCMAVDTACSSSLVAAHLACRSLRDREADLAIAGGVNLILSPRGTIYFCQVGVMSPTGRCKTFDAGADGYVRGEGCGIVVLKRLSDAMADGDPIVALIRGSAVNHDGKSGGLTVPSGRAQRAVVERALADGGVAAADVDFVETHGTGTPLGDPIEVRALAEVFGKRPADRQLTLGAVKTNIGHTESAAGVAGLIKAALAVKTGEIPANLHLVTPNPHVPLAEMNALVPTETVKMRPGRRFAGVSSFGISGTNAHVVLESPPAVAEQPAPDSNGPLILPLSARSSGALKALASRYLDLLDGRADPTGSVAAICAAAARRRNHHDYRLAVAFEQVADLRDALRAFADDESRPGLAVGRRLDGRDAKLVFVFGGQGSQRPGMCRALVSSNPTFRTALDRCGEAIYRETGWSVRDVLLHDDEVALQDIAVVQPTLFAIQVALAELVGSWGVQATAVVGQSMGEVAAAHVAGALTLDDAARVICRRSRLLREISGAGGMAVVDLSFADTERLISRWNGRMSVSVSSSPRSTVVAGDVDAVKELGAALTARGIFWRMIDVTVASHTAQVDPLRAPLMRELDGLGPRQPSLPMYSTVLGARADGAVFDADYWMRNLRQPVLLATTVEALIDDGRSVFLELGPHPVVSPAIDQTIAHHRRPGRTVAALRRDAPELLTLQHAVGEMYAAGCAVEWKSVYTSAPAVPLPTYPWQHERHWLETSLPQRRGAGRAPGRGYDHPMLGEHVQSAVHSGVHLWERPLGLRTHPYLADHRVSRAVVFPAAGYVEMALAGARAVFGTSDIQLEGVTFHRPLILPEDGTRSVQLVISNRLAGTASFEILSREDARPEDDSESQPQPWVSHVSGNLRSASGTDTDEAEEPGVPVEITEFQDQCHELLTGDGIYAAMENHGLRYGPAFRTVDRAWRHETEVLGSISLNGSSGWAQPSFVVHPALLDACFQLLAVTAPLQSGAAAGDVFVPTGFRSLRVRRPATQGRWGFARLHPAETADAVEGDVELLDESGQVLVEVRGLRAQAVDGGTTQADPRVEDWMFRLDWRALPEAPASQSIGHDDQWLLVGDDGDLADAVAARLEMRGLRCVVARSGDRLRRDPSGADDIWTIDPRSPAQYRDLLRQAYPDGPPTAVVQLCGVGAGAVPSSAESLRDGVASGTASVLHLAQALAQTNWRDSPRLWVVTTGAQAVVSGDEVAPAQAPVWGLARVISHELPELQCSRVDLGGLGGPLDTVEIDRLCDVLLADGPEDQIAIRGPVCHVARLSRFVPVAEVEDEPATIPAVDGEPSFRLEIGKPGILDRLTLQASERREPGPDEVEIDVHAAGVNFSDVMKVMGVYPSLDDSPPVIGGECAGRVARAGSGVTRVSAGDRVAAIAPWSLASHVTVAEPLVIQIPDDISYVDAATVPVAFLTAYYALHDIARLGPGERVLIHSASGGVGLAAIQVARAVGAEIFATAGSAERREFLTALGVTHVMDSRSLTFASEILDATAGEGVDVVLNSLAGPAISKGLAVVRPFGRFVEIGKRDIYQGGTLGLEAFRKNLLFASVDLEEALRERPALVVGLLDEIAEKVRSGEFTPLNAESYPMSEAVDAFHRMAQAKHLGKTVLLPREGEIRIRPRKADQPRFRADGSYLLTGGLGALGMCTAKWLAARGAKHIALLGRRPEAEAPTEVLAEIRSLREAGLEVLTLAADVGDQAELQAALEKIDTTMPPLCGVIHAAGILDDGLLMQLDWSRFEGVLRAKVQGSWNLHVATAERSLDFFVLFSSGASLLGSPGQANYSAANAFLDALAHHRRARGLPALAINWGPWSEVGLAARPDRGGRLALRGFESLSPEQGLEALGRLMRETAPQVAVMPIDVRRWRQFYPKVAELPVLADLVEAAARPRPIGEGTFRKELLAADPGPRRRAALEGHLQDQVAQVLRISRTQIDIHTPLDTLGFDSLMALELRNRLEASLGVGLSATMAWNYPTIAEIAPHLAEKMGVPLEARPAADDSPDEELAEILDRVSAMSESEMAASGPEEYADE